jgi:hypothetical protein
MAASQLHSKGFSVQRIGWPSHSWLAWHSECRKDMTLQPSLSDPQTMLRTISSLPISAEDALPILASLSGPISPAEWHGALDLPHYRVGRGARALNFSFCVSCFLALLLLFNVCEEPVCACASILKLICASSCSISSSSCLCFQVVIICILFNYLWVFVLSQPGSRLHKHSFAGFVAYSWQGALRMEVVTIYPGLKLSDTQGFREGLTIECCMTFSSPIKL